MLRRWAAFLLITILVYLTVIHASSTSTTWGSLQRTTSTAPDPLAESSTDYFNQSSPIIVDSNQDFEGLSLGGTGAEGSPYIIERLRIVSTGFQNSSISVSHTSAHLIIRDCYVETDWVGIEIRDVAEGTVRIVNNTCISHSGEGAGIVVWGMQNCTIVGNRCSHLAQGIHLNEAGRCYIASNNVTDNDYQGINIRYSHSNTITDNIIANSSQHGLALVGTSSHNVIHHNEFLKNGNEATYRIDGEPRGELTSQGFDEGNNNTWYDAAKEEGNKWSDYSGSGSYSMDGPSNSVDLYPTATEGQSQSLGYDSIQVVVLISLVGGVVTLLAWRLLRSR